MDKVGAKWSTFSHGVRGLIRSEEEYRLNSAIYTGMHFYHSSSSRARFIAFMPRRQQMSSATGHEQECGELICLVLTYSGEVYTSQTTAPDRDLAMTMNPRKHSLMGD